MFFSNIIAHQKLKILAAIFFTLFILTLITIFAILTLKIKIKIKNLEIFSENKKKIKDGYRIKLSIFIFNIVKIINFDFSKEKILKIKKNNKIEKIKKKLRKKINQKKKKYNIKDLIKNIKKLKYMNIKLKNFNLNLEIGTENAATTSFIIAGISSILGIILKNNIEKENRFKVNPIYRNENLLLINLEGEITISLGRFIRMIILENIVQKQTDSLKYRLKKNVNTN